MNSCKTSTFALIGLLLVGCAEEPTTTMVFEIDTDRAIAMGLLPDGEQVADGAIDRMIEVIGRRLNTMEGYRTTTTQHGEDGSIHVIVVGDDAELQDRIEQRLIAVGLLEISRVANPVDDERICEIGLEAASAGDKDVMLEDALVARWIPFAPDADDNPKDVNMTIGSQVHEFDYLDHPDWPHLLMVVEPDPEWRITGEVLELAYACFDQNGNPAVGFQFNDAGAERFHSLTLDYQPRVSGQRTSLAVILNGEIHSAPAIEEPISGGAGIIHGSFTQAEVDDLVSVLNSGALEYPLKLREVIAAVAQTSE